MSERFTRSILAALALAVLAVGAQPAPVFAKDLFTGGTSGIDCSGAARNSAVCAEHGTTDNPVSDRLHNIGNVVAYAAGAAAVVLMIVGGIRYILSNGDSNKIASAKSTIIHALVGLIIIVAARAILFFVLKRL